MKICVFSGKIGGFSAMLPLIQEMERDPFFDLTVLLGDQHLSPVHGRSSEWVEGVLSPDTPTLRAGDAGGYRPLTITGLGAEIAAFFLKEKPDVIVLFGDRAEVLQIALLAYEMGIPIAHVQGGDTSGGVDNAFRRALSELATWHFVSTTSSASKLPPHTHNVYIVGDLHVDPIIRGMWRNRAEVNDALGLEREEKVVLLLQHPDTLSPSTAYEDMNETLMALYETPGIEKVIALYPCTDNGHKETLAALQDFEKNNAEVFDLYDFLEPPLFLGLLRRASFIIGNSSCGLIEAPYLGTPAVDVGNRQRGRLRGDSVFSAASEGRQDILSAIKSALSFNDVPSLLYGEGGAYKKIISILKGADNDNT